MSFIASKIIAVIAVVMFGVGSAICTVGIPVWAGDLYRREHFSDSVRRMQLIYAAGAMLFASLPGMIADIFESYIPYYALFALLTVVSSAFVAYVYKNHYG